MTANGEKQHGRPSAGLVALTSDLTDMAHAWQLESALWHEHKLAGFALRGAAQLRLVTELASLSPEWHDVAVAWLDTARATLKLLIQARAEASIGNRS